MAAAGASVFSTTRLLHACEASMVPSSEGRSYSDQFPNMLETYLADRLNRLATSWDVKRSLIRTAADVKERNRTVRENLLSMLGELRPRADLNAVTVKTAVKDGYRVDNVMFESRPGLWVTGNLYVPTKRSGKLPAIISPCGHYPLARMTPQYQSAYISLVKSGFVVFAYDPLGQGERRQYWNPATNSTDVGGPIFEHSMAGQLLLLFGENLTSYFVWDGMRSIDYLLTRMEVDPERIGCVGHSGGGTLTKFIAVADERVRCAVILEGGTANQWPTKRIGIADIEQNLFPAALNGVDNVDLHAAIAPRPLLVGIEAYSPAFLRAAVAIRARYEQLGAGGKFETIAAEDPHAWSPKLRRAAIDWFCRWFYARPGPDEETGFETSPPEDLYCTTKGSLLYSHQGDSIFSSIKRRADRPPSQDSPSGEASDPSSHLRHITDRLAVLLRFKSRDEPFGSRLIAKTPREGYRIEKSEILSEPGIYIPVWTFIPEQVAHRRKTILFLSDEGIQQDGMEYEGAEGAGLARSVLDQLVRAGHMVIAADIRGIGFTRMSRSSELSSGRFGELFGGDTSAAYACWSMGGSLFGMRVEDIVRCVHYAMQQGGVDGHQLHLIGKGRAALWCLCAAALEPRIASLICDGGLVSYRALATSDRYVYGADIFIPEICRYFDLPDVASTIAPRPLAVINLKDGMKRDADIANATEAYRCTQEAYRRANAEQNFRIQTSEAGGDEAQLYLQLLSAVGTTSKAVEMENTGVST